MPKSSPITLRLLGAFTILDKPFELTNLAPLVECALATRTG